MIRPFTPVRGAVRAFNIMRNTSPIALTYAPFTRKQMIVSGKHMRIICAWCGLMMQDGSLPASHGMCVACIEKDDYRAFYARCNYREQAYMHSGVSPEDIRYLRIVKPELCCVSSEKK